MGVCGAILEPHPSGSFAIEELCRHSDPMGCGAYAEEEERSARGRGNVSNVLAALGNDDCGIASEAHGFSISAPNILKHNPLVRPLMACF